jgi:two-component system NtrC family sensor kinase
MSTPKLRRILVVDDEPLNQKMMASMLSREGYEVVEAGNGQEALLRVKEKPDLILLDIMMPVLDGFETCRLLKADSTTKDIPVIFLSALQDSKTKLDGFSLGGVDFISKPFQREELLARVRTHLTMREQEVKLREYADRLETMVEERTAQLVHADRLATLGTLVSAVNHEINNPLQTILGNGELALLELDDLKRSLSALTSPAKGPEAGAIETLMDKLEYGLREINRGALKVAEIIKMMKEFGKKETVQVKPFPLVRPIREALAIMHPKLKIATFAEIHVSDDLMIRGNQQQFSQIFINLVQNSLDALEGQKGYIIISAQVNEAKEVIIDFKDSGQGVPDHLSDIIFDPFFTTKGEKEGTGLGLFITRRIIEKHRGRIQIVRHGGRGVWFRITLPPVH